MASATQLGYLGLSVSNVDEWERFVAQILGLQANGRDDAGRLLALQPTPPLIGLRGDAAGSQAPASLHAPG